MPLFEHKCSHFDFVFRLGYTHIVDLLLKNGADVNAENKDKGTPLHWAASNGEVFYSIEIL